MEFRTVKPDAAVTVISLLTTAFLSAMSVFFIIKVPLGIVFACGMMSIVLISYWLAPRRYRFEGSRFVIEKVSGKRISIDIADIRGYTVVDDFAKLKPLRAFGNGGLFGYYGLFTTRDYGTINCQLTSLKNIVIIETRRGYYAISPAETERFTGFLHTAIKGISGNVTRASPDVREPAPPVSVLYLLIPDVILMLTVVMVLLWYPHLPEKVATHFNFQGQPDGWSGRSAFLWMSLVPSAIVFILNTALFLILRSHRGEPKTAVFVLLLFSGIQLFLAFVNFDLCWFNTRGVHAVPIQYAVIALFALIGIFIWGYYKRLKRST